MRQSSMPLFPLLPCRRVDIPHSVRKGMQTCECVYPRCDGCANQFALKVAKVLYPVVGLKS